MILGESYLQIIQGYDGSKMLIRLVEALIVHASEDTHVYLIIFVLILCQFTMDVDTLHIHCRLFSIHHWIMRTSVKFHVSSQLVDSSYEGHDRQSMFSVTNNTEHV